MYLYCDSWRRNFNPFDRFENQAVQVKSKRGWISALHESLRKGGIKNDFVYVQTSDGNFPYQLRSKPLTHQIDFDLKYTQNSLLLRVASFLYHYAQILKS